MKMYQFLIFSMTWLISQLIVLVLYVVLMRLLIYFRGWNNSDMIKCVFCLVLLGYLSIHKHVKYSTSGQADMFVLWLRVFSIKWNIGCDDGNACIQISQVYACWNDSSTEVCHIHFFIRRWCILVTLLWQEKQSSNKTSSQYRTGTVFMTNWLLSFGLYL